MKDIPGYEGLYALTEDLRVWSYPKTFAKNRKHEGKFISIRKNNLGYIVCELTGKGNRNRKCHKIHRLVALTYIPNPENFPVVMHLDNDKTNYSISNLAWGTQSTNIKQEFDEKRRPTKKVMQLTKEGILCKVYDSISLANKITKIGNSCIVEVLKGRRKFAGGYRWAYFNY